MKKRTGILLFHLIAFVFLAQAQPSGTWKMYLNYNNSTTITIVENTVFLGTNRQMFSLNTDNNEMATFTRLDGLTDYNIAHLGYDPFNQTILIVYNNSAIDLYKNGTIQRISDIQRADVGSDVTINDIYIYNQLAYLSTNIGIIVFDISRKEIKDTYIIGANGTRTNINQISIDNNFIWAATDSGLLYAPINAPLWNFASWQPVSDLPLGTSCKYVVNTVEKIWAVVDNVLYAGDSNGQNWLPIIGDNTWTFEFARPGTNGKALFGQTQDGGTSGNSRLLVFGNDITPNIITHPTLYLIRDVVMQGDNVYWVADSWFGLHKITQGSDGQVYEEKFKPAGPYDNFMANLAIRGSDLWVAPVQLDGAHNGDDNNPLRPMRFYNGQWYDWDFKDSSVLDNALDICRVAVHPNADLVYWGSWRGGLIEHNFKDNTFQQYLPNNSSLQADPASNGDRIEVTGLAFDTKANLWVTNQYTTRPISVKTNDGQWYSFKPSISLNSNILSRLVVDDCDQKWIINYRDGLLLFNHGKDLENTNDDQYLHFVIGESEDALPSSDIFAIAKDRDGYIWVGTSKGVAYFSYPCNAFSANSSIKPTRPKVKINGQVAYLLQDVSVQSIAVDAANRKWVGTLGGGLWLFSTDGTETIKHFTTANSPMLSNNVFDIAIDNNTGEVFINNEYGLLSYKSDALGASDTYGQISVYPNPVRPEYVGDIAIKGLAQDASVKITDIAGNLVYETKALGSQAIWDGRDYTGRKVVSGVYLVLSINEYNNDSAISKIMIIR